MKVAIYTLGCKVNQYETQALETELIHRGHTLASFEGEADAYIINTCSVTAVSDKKSRNIVRRARRRCPNAIVAVCGCYVQTHVDEAQTLGADLLMGTNDRMAFLDELEHLAARRSEPIVKVDDALKRRQYEILPAGGMDGRTRALLKIEDGCVNFCSYCIIPYARGPIRSRPLADAIAETVRLAEEGYLELVLTGIEISSWGRDLEGKPELIDLIEAICTAVPHMRIRLGSLEPRTITEDFCRRAAVLPNLCPHFHLSLQSGCDTTLNRMNRKYDTHRYLESVTLLRKYFDAPAITTDLIVGFPGEDESEFTQTLDFIQTCDFSSMHIFPYSPRPGTPAASMKEQVPGPVKEERAQRAAQVSEEMEKRYLDGLKGRRLSVLFEQDEDGCSKGHAPNYAEVRIPTPGLHNVVLDVTITGTADHHLTGE